MVKRSYYSNKYNHVKNKIYAVMPGSQDFVFVIGRRGAVENRSCQHANFKAEESGRSALPDMHEY